MLKKAVFPGKYIQGVGAVRELPGFIGMFGKQGLILASPSVSKRVLPSAGISTAAPDRFTTGFGGECCEDELARLSALISENHVDVLVGMGCGKTSVFSFCEEIGLPTTLTDIGLGDTPRQSLLLAAEKACSPEQPIHHEAGEMSPARVLDAMLAADAIGMRRKGTDAARLLAAPGFDKLTAARGGMKALP